MFMHECGKYFKHPALINVDHVLEPVHHLSVWTPVNMASHSCTDRSFSYSKYYLELKGDAKKRYNYKWKLKLISFKEDPYCQVESPAVFLTVPIQWHEWSALMHANIYNYLILTPSLYTHEQLKSYKSLDAYNQFVNGWVSDIVMTVNSAGKAKIYLL